MSSIAIVGMACRFPGAADTLEGYWDLLTHGECAISEIPQERWTLEGFYDPRVDIPTRSYSKWGGFLKDVRRFDPSFFDLSPREAESMDPQQRLLLEVAYEAVQDGSITLQELRERTTGVFIGASNIDYNLLQRFRHDRGDILAGTGNALSIVANRVSNTLNLTGPSVVTDTACSSSLVALDTACRHLRDGSCNTALVGGANILLDPRMFITFSRAHMLSPTGRIRAFDEHADGFVRGEGVGLLLLKRLEDAEADGNKVYATVEATAINQDGGTGTITAPNPDAQIAMMRSVLARSNFQANDITFAEAHGTGTSVGDPIEVNAIGTVFGGQERTSPLLVGSSKTNLGHLEPAAGIAGLIKAALSLSRGVLPPTVGYESPNPKIDFTGHNVEVVHEKCASLLNPRNAIGLVNSFGFGGTNACALLKAAPQSSRITLARPTEERPQPDRAKAFPISAPTEDHLRAYARALAQHLEDGTLASHSLDAIAHALGTQRDHFAHRAVLISNTRQGLLNRLETLAKGEMWPRENKTDPPGIVAGRAAEGGKLAFTMTGQGGQWWAMGRDLLLHNKAFREFFETFDARFKPVSGWSVIDAMMADERTSELDDAAITPAVMFAFQCGLAETWRSIGVSPDLVVGHSFGEVTAAYLAGGISLDHVAKLVMYRGLIRGDVDRVGTMAAIGLGANDIQEFLPTDGSVEIGGYNSPNLVTLTGEEKSIEQIITNLNRTNPDIVTRKLALDFAYHSSWFEPVEDLFKENVGDLQWTAPDIPVISTVTGNLNETFDANYWWSNLRYPVRYQDGINRALDMGATTFIELGPTRTLSSMTAGCAAEHGIPVQTVSTLQKRWNDFESIATAVGELYCGGYDVDWTAVNPATAETVRIPNQPWMSERYWSAPKEAAQALTTERVHPLLGQRNDTPGQSWTQHISLETHPFLSDHRINDQVVYPAAGYLEAIYEAASQYWSTDRIEIRDVAFHAALYLTPGDEIEVRTAVHTALNRIEIHSRTDNIKDVWELRASGYVLPYASRANTELPQHEGTEIDSEQFYTEIQAQGYQYGLQFKNLDCISVADTSACAHLVPPSARDTTSCNHTLPTPLLDATFQLMLTTSLKDFSETSLPGLYLPTNIKRVAISQPLRAGDTVTTHRNNVTNPKTISCDFHVRGLDGTIGIAVSQLQARLIPTACERAPGTTKIYRDEWVDWTVPDVTLDHQAPWLALQNQKVRRVSNVADIVTQTTTATSLQRGIVDATAAWTDALNATVDFAPTLAGIVYKPDVSLNTLSNIEGVTAELERQSQEILAVGRALKNVSEQMSLPRIWILLATQPQTTSTDHPQHDGLAHGTLLGAVRTIQMECPNLSYATIQCNTSGNCEHTYLLRILSSNTSDTEFLIDRGEIKVRRLCATEGALASRTTPARKLRDHLSYKLTAQSGGGPETVRWQTAVAKQPEVEEVQVEITHVGLNFRDIMAVTGALPDGAELSPAIEALGLEFAGRIVDTGADVTQFNINDRVFGMSRGTLTKRLNLSPSTLFRIPENVADAEAATLCSAFLTADYALNHVGRLKKGEKVLIHNGTGAVGLAAIALATACGAEIYTTAGQQRKRQHLRDMGLQHVFDSRSLSFADDIIAQTNGYGVDVVLNALSGPYIVKALDCLAPYGRFLEIGKSDVYGNRAIGMKSLRANQSFHVIDIAAMLHERPNLIRRIMEDLLPRFASGALSPLPHEIYPAHRVENAFRHFAKAEHIGKVVIDQTDPTMTVETPATKTPSFDPHGTYLVTGGSRGMGLQAARWLRDNGAGHVIAVSRNGRAATRATSGGRDNSSPPEPREYCQLDVANETDVRRRIEHIEKSDKPLKGVIHAAVVYDDAVMTEMTDDALHRVLQPKIQGGLNLTQAVLDTGAKLDFFLSFSSAACVTGWPGQSNYTAANAALECLARWQRDRGIAGQCVHWGVFGETGHVSESKAMSSYLANAGWGALSDADVYDHLACILNSDEPVVTVTQADWAVLAARHPAIARSPRFAELCVDGSTSGNAQNTALTANNADMPEQALRIVREQVANVLRVEPETLCPYETISDAGIDSLSAFELRNRLEQATNFEISLGRFVSASRFDELADLLCTIAQEHIDKQTKDKTHPIDPSRSNGHCEVQEKS